MKKMLMAAGMAAVMTACGTAGQKAATDAGNPFLAEYSTPFGVPPFDLIKVEHYKEAFLKGMEEQKKEIDAIDNHRIQCVDYFLGVSLAHTSLFGNCCHEF